MNEDEFVDALTVDHVRVMNLFSSEYMVREASHDSVQIDGISYNVFECAKLVCVIGQSTPLTLCKGTKFFIDLDFNVQILPSYRI